MIDNTRQVTANARAFSNNDLPPSSAGELSQVIAQNIYETLISAANLVDHAEQNHGDGSVSTALRRARSMDTDALKEEIQAIVLAGTWDCRDSPERAAHHFLLTLLQNLATRLEPPPDSEK